MTSPAGFRALPAIRRGRGTLEFFAREDPAALLVRASGCIGPALIREDLACAESFGREHAAGWDYIADTSRVRFANPLNALLLRRIRRLPHLGRYIVIAPSIGARLAIGSLSWLVKPDAILSSFDRLGEVES